jgi:hypothetical protein
MALFVKEFDNTLLPQVKAAAALAGVTIREWIETACRERLAVRAPVTVTRSAHEVADLPDDLGHLTE